MQKILSAVRKAVDEYGMIETGDRIAVGISGGKDSLLLLLALKELQRFYPKSFEVMGISIDMGFDGMDYSPIQRLCDEIGVSYQVVKTDIAEIIFDLRKEPNPCSLCAKLRRGALNDAAKAAGCNKVALGHHHDDAVETFMMNLIYEGRIGCFSPVTYLDRTDVTVIRPMLYLTESEVKRIEKSVFLPVVKNKCPADGHTKREYVKNLLHDLEQEVQGTKVRIQHAMEKAELDGWKLPNPGRRYE
ncbi:MAG: tRNA 2-thiocytidine(32) synthetase TtcA [Clostridia bacterium]|nr:tRNA 2-thiocytidine(32) synthetase TtcA [Clostridia bacterium]